MKRMMILMAVGLMFVACQAGARDAVATWTAPVDEKAGGVMGRAAYYDLRYKTTPPAADTLLWWQNAARVPNLPVPSVAGAQDSVEMTGLDPGVNYYFVIVAVDSAGNRSFFSNTAHLAALDMMRPATIGGFTVRPK